MNFYCVPTAVLGRLRLIDAADSAAAAKAAAGADRVTGGSVSVVPADVVEQFDISAVTTITVVKAP